MKSISAINENMADMTMDFSTFSPLKEVDETCMDILTQMNKKPKNGVDIGT
jgi:hypothetical protein